jgi:hypothetical protein
MGLSIKWEMGLANFIGNINTLLVITPEKSVGLPVASTREDRRKSIMVAAKRKRIDTKNSIPVVP